ncbi:MAG: gamma-glutamyl-gamma-aminobutyrate hydrolase family protein [Lachnospiraceae bacterium]
MRRPMIGLIPLYDEHKESYWMLPGYMTGLEAAGAVPVMLPLTADAEVIGQLAEQLDGFLLTGGDDVNPALYGEEPLPEGARSCPQRDAMESILVKLALQYDKPIFGICRGIQILNTMMGGTLYQDIPTQRPGGCSHQMTPPYDRAVHQVRIEAGTPLYELLGKETIAVNSYHHQAIKDLAPGLVTMAYSEDGLIEAVYAPEQSFVMAVQWHPEFSYRVNEDSRKLFAKFTESC